LNCIDLFVKHLDEKPEAPALWLPKSGVTPFQELASIAAKFQKVCRKEGVGAGDGVLLLDGLGPRLYGTVIGILAMGGSVILVEPWMPVRNINHVIESVKPKMFITSLIGRLWGMRVPSIRAIPKWIGARAVLKASSKGLHVESVDKDTHGIITFTSGTTGNPKGVVRNQGYLVDQHRVLSRALGLDQIEGPDLCIFANFVLANLASGRGSIVVPPAWKRSHLRRIDALPEALQPRSVTCGPAFLLKMLRDLKAPHLESVHVGGALTDCWIFEEGFKKWPKAHWTHVYGSSEAEPVGTADTRVAVQKSRDRGCFQTLFLGDPVDEIRSLFEEDGLWVSGPHVCPRYLGNEEENRINKRLDENGILWHFMGDRVIADESGWWYSGRSSQPLEEFVLEQEIYSYLQSSKSFIHRDKKGRLYLIGEKLKKRKSELLEKFKDLHDVIEGKIYRDRRHRARIDRAKSTRKVVKCLAG
jgi:acyl-coenzyme A synthetase/AMP-(fatty) acid ligase